MIKPLVFSIGDSPVRKKGGKAVLTCVDHPVFSGYIEICFLLAGETCIGEILCRCGASHCNIRIVSVLVTELLVGFCDSISQIIRQLRIINESPDLFSPFREISHVVRIKIRQKFLDFIFNARRFQ